MNCSVFETSAKPSFLVTLFRELTLKGELNPKIKLDLNDFLYLN